MTMFRNEVLDIFWAAIAAHCHIQFGGSQYAWVKNKSSDLMHMPVSLSNPKVSEGNFLSFGEQETLADVSCDL